jgi:excisionase family DNA binding protein
MTQRNVEEAARVVGIGKRTLYRWLQDPELGGKRTKGDHSIRNRNLRRHGHIHLEQKVTF